MFKRVVTLSLADLKNIYREPLLFMSILAPVLLTLFVKFVFPFIFNLVREKTGFDLTIYSDLIYSFIIVFTPMMLGVLAGFLILDERDADILIYLAVTPLSKRGYLYYRLFFPVLISIVLSLLIFYYLAVQISILRLIPLLIIAAMEAPIMTLFLGSTANNKVEGIALSKAMGIMFVAPVVAYFVRNNWQYIAGIFPTYWVSQAFIVEDTFRYFIMITAGLLVHVVYFYFLLKKFEKKTG